MPTDHIVLYMHDKGVVTIVKNHVYGRPRELIGGSVSPLLSWANIPKRLV
ncbi:hypothetical protein LY11_03599 [Pedobacter cryoconitis]|uniref:Uncharacterized protein n=1 Tax=Pedobacter cryoconitis TaxID=188932 RepID=A0A327SEX9_9SPHI|nr:hypothetical protein LY11_03599 [Pedobacter cryoconitis]